MKEIILAILSWIVGYLVAQKINQENINGKRKRLIDILKSELESISKIDVIRMRTEIENRVAETGEGLFITPFRIDYIDWLLSQGALDPKKDRNLINKLINVKATLTNFNMAVFMWNIGSLNDFSIVHGFGDLSEEHIDELRQEINQ